MNTARTLKPFTLFGIFVWLIASLFFFYEFAIRTFLGTLINQIVPALSITTNQYAFLGTVFYIFFCFMQVPSGTITDHYGVKWPMFFGLIICALGVLMLAHADSYTMALIARALMAVGASFAFICLLVVAATWFSPAYFATMCGLSQFLGTLGPALASGPLVNHMLSAHGSWRELLVTVGFAGVGIAFVTLLFVSKGPFEQTKQSVSTDSFSQVLKKLFNNKQVIWIGVYSATNYCSIALLAEVWGTRLFETHGLTQIQSNHIVSLSWYAYAAGCLLLGWLSDYLKNRRQVMLWSSLLGFISACALLYAPSPHIMFFEITLIGIGFTAGGQNVGFAAVIEHVPQDLKAASLGFNNMSIGVLNIILPISVGIILSKIGSNNIEALTSHEMAIALSVSPLIFLISTLTAIFLIKESRSKIAIA